MAKHVKVTKAVIQNAAGLHNSRKMNLKSARSAAKNHKPRMKGSVPIVKPAARKKPQSAKHAKNEPAKISRQELSASNEQAKRFQESIQLHAKKVDAAKNEIENVVKGQGELISNVLRGFICNGNILLEGLPGLGKTLLCRAMAKICDIEFRRVQFTTDLLPSDIIGIISYDQKKGFEVIKGPIFCNLMLADEINRAPPKVQSALLEAMGERQVTIGKETHILKDPFLVLATQNPIEQSGTFPLPEAQVDRFMFKVDVQYPDFDSELMIIDKNLSSMKFENFNLQKMLSIEDILKLQALKDSIHTETKLKHYILNLVHATRNPYEARLKHAEFVSMGASPRASISLLLAAKAQALMMGRHYVVPQDVKDVIHQVLRHRIYLNFRAKMENVSTDDVINDLFDKIKIY